MEGRSLKKECICFQLVSFRSLLFTLIPTIQRESAQFIGVSCETNSTVAKVQVFNHFLIQFNRDLKSAPAEFELSVP